MNQYGLHSPFLFELYVACFKPSFKHDFPVIDKIRAGIMRNNEFREIMDHGAGSLVNNAKEKRVSQMYKSASISKKQGELFSRLIKYFKPASVLELGTHLGVSGLYFLHNSDCKLHTIEGCLQTQEIAMDVLKAYQHRTHFYLGTFEEKLMKVLDEIEAVNIAYVDGNHSFEGTMWNYEQILPFTTSESVLIFDDINWSPDMKKAWDEIRSRPEVSISINCYKFGMVFFRDGVQKQDFYFRF